MWQSTYLTMSKFKVPELSYFPFFFACFSGLTRGRLRTVPPLQEWGRRQRETFSSTVEYMQHMRVLCKQCQQEEWYSWSYLRLQMSLREVVVIPMKSGVPELQMKEHTVVPCSKQDFACMLQTEAIPLKTLLHTARTCNIYTS